MFRTKIFKFFALCAVVAQASCSMIDSGKNAKIEADELVFAANPEPAEGKQDVYASISRAVKYNVDVFSHNLNKKISGFDNRKQPDEVIKEIISNNVNDENRLVKVSRVLEFAIVDAVSVLNDSQPYRDNYFYETSSKHLALAAIKTHQEAWFAKKKIKELERILRQEGKVVEALNAKEKRSGTLSDKEYEYRKNQEVRLLKITELNKNLSFAILEYGDLTKTEPKKVELEGRRFYELDDFDKNYSIEIFQEAAIRNRKEFAQAKEKVKSYTYADMRHEILQNYPLVPSLDINGLKIENSVYERELYAKSVKVAQNLLQAVADFAQTKTKSNDYQMLRRRVFDELGAAIFSQIELNYQMVKLADSDYDAAMRAQADLKKEIQRLNKIYHPTDADKLALLSAKITMIEMEHRLAQIKADRAVALRSLYFNAGLSPFNKMLLKAPIKDIAQTLKQYYNRDLIEMMSAVKSQMNATSTAVKNERGWAQTPNWLEDVVASAAKSRPTVKYAAKSADYHEMQLGAYEYKENADADWAMLSFKFPELKAYQPEVVVAEIDGRRWFRLVVRGSSAELQKNCRYLKANGNDCLLH